MLNIFTISVINSIYSLSDHPDYRFISGNTFNQFIKRIINNRILFISYLLNKSDCPFYLVL